MSDPDENIPDAEQAAELAYARADSYVWCGHPIKWSRRANWLFVAILRGGNYVGEQIALIMMWIGSRPDMRETERRWHRDKEDLLDELSDFLCQFGDLDDETASALEVGRQIHDDEEASRNDLDASDGDSEGVPKKSHRMPPTSSTSTDAQE